MIVIIGITYRLIFILTNSNHFHYEKMIMINILLHPVPFSIFLPLIAESGLNSKYCWQVEMQLYFVRPRQFLPVNFATKLLNN